MSAPPVVAHDAPQPEAPASSGTDSGRSAVSRIVLAVLSLGSLLLGLLAVAIGAHGLRWPALLLFWWLGVGSAPWQLNAKLGLSGRLTLTAVTGLGVLILPATWMLMTGHWHPAIAFAIVAVLSAPLHALGLVSAIRDRAGREARQGRPWWTEPGSWSSRAAASPAPVLAVVGTLACLGAALAHQHVVPGFGGFLTQIGPVWYIGLVLLIAAIALARGGNERAIAVPVILFLGVLLLTPSLVYGTPHVQSAYKHVDLVQQIITRGTQNSYIDIYDAWPGLFAGAAWLCDVAGIRESLHLATYWPALIGIFQVAALRYFFGQLLPTPLQRWMAVVLAVLADSLGQGYFSPQSVGYVLGIAALGLALSQLTAFVRLPMVALAGCAIAVTHQFSPFVVGGALVVLVVFRMVRPWWTPLLVIVPGAGWTLLHLSVVQNFFSFGSLFRAENFRTPTAGLPSGLARLPIVAVTTYSLVAGVLLVGLPALVALLANRRDRTAWGMACASLVGFVLVLTNPYGQEGLFRATLFALPWLAGLAGRLFRPAPTVRARVPIGILAMALTVTFLLASFGLDAARVMRPGDAAAVEYFSQEGEPKPDHPYYLLYLGAGDQPTTLDVAHVTVGRDAIHLPFETQRQLAPEQLVPQLTQNFVDYADARARTFDVFAIWSPAAEAFGDAYGIQSPAQSVALLRAFQSSRYWQVVFRQDGTYLFRLQQSVYGSAGA